MSPKQRSDNLEKIVGLLGSALIQAISSDDQIIMERVREAHEIALMMYRDACAERRTDR